MSASHSTAAVAQLAKINVSTLRSRIAQQIRQAILTGVLREGERLVERTLAVQLGASLSAVREAMVELETEGFLTKKPNAATFVTRLSWPEVEKIFAVRRVLESYAIEQAALQAAPEQVEEADEICRQMVLAARAHNSEAFSRHDVAFHQLLWRCTGNEYLEAALRRAVLPFFAFAAIRITAPRGPRDLGQDAGSHLPILEAVKRRDPAAAKRAFLSGLDEWFRLSRFECTDS